MDVINDNVPEHLKCPICFEMPEGKIFQCKDGHVIGEECYMQLKECPQCRVPFDKNAEIRNRLMESMLDELKMECPYHASGCKEKLDRKTIRQHVESCRFRDTK